MNPPIEQPIKPPSFESAKPGLAAITDYERAATFEPVAAVFQGISAGNDILNLIKVIAYWVARGIILPAELVLRRRMGERYISMPVFMVFTFVMIVASGADVIGPNTVFIISAVYGGALVFHFYALKAAHCADIYWHSFSEGESRLQSVVPEAFGYFRDQTCTLDVAKNFVEPALVFAIGLACVPWGQISGLWSDPEVVINSASTGSWLIITALTMFTYQYYCSRVRRRQLLDYLDARLMLEIGSKISRRCSIGKMHSTHGIAYIDGATLSIRAKMAVKDSSPE